MAATDFAITDKTIRVTQLSVAGLAFDGSALWFYSADEQKHVRIDFDGKILQEIETKNCGCDTEFDGKLIWQARPKDNKIVKVDPEQGQMVDYIDLPDTPSGLATDGYNWYRGSHSRKGIIRFDPESGADLEVFETPQTTSGIADDGQYLWHGANDDGHKLFKFDPELKELAGEFDLPFRVHGVTYDGSDLLVVNGDANEIVRIAID